MTRHPTSSISGRASRVLQASLWLPIGHLAAVSLAGSLPTHPPPPSSQPQHRFVVLIPGRNEQDQVHMPIRSALASSYPASQRRVVVVADNCSDATADRARAEGVEVWERTDPARASKGAAVGWALERLLPKDDWDAVVFLDADAVVDADFFQVIDRRLAQGHQVVQGERHVTNAAGSLVARLAQMSSAAQCVLRPRGRARLGGAAKLVGNGMVIHRQVFGLCPWRAEGLVEDVEYWLELLARGVHPVHEPFAMVSDLMPTHLASARVQRTRWEAGRWGLVRDRLAPLGLLAVRRRDPVLAEALVSELAFPNLSVTGGAVALAGLARWALTGRGKRVATAQSAVLAGHLLLSLRVSKATPASYAALALAPLVAAWRLWVTADAMVKRRTLGWHGTPRAP